MLIGYFKFLFFFVLVFMSLVGWSSNNWFLVWMMMEVMFLFFMGFMSLDVNYSVVEVMMKYYLIQVFFSLLLMGLMVFFFI